MKVKKDPQAVLDYSFDWSEWLNGDQIASVLFKTTGAIVVDSFTNTTATATAWVSGGLLGEQAELTCQVTTNSAPARIDERTMILQIVQR